MILRDKLEIVIDNAYKILDESDVKVKMEDYTICVQSYDMINAVPFGSCCNVFVSVLSNRGYEYYLDLYQDKFCISTYNLGDFNVNVVFDQFYPLTEESFFQMQTMYDLNDLTFQECYDIIELCVKIPLLEDY